VQNYPSEICRKRATKKGLLGWIYQETFYKRVQGIIFQIASRRASITRHSFLGSRLELNLYLKWMSIAMDGTDGGISVKTLVTPTNRGEIWQSW
jgi:hypothetical protein